MSAGATPVDEPTGDPAGDAVDRATGETSDPPAAPDDDVPGDPGSGSPAPDGAAGESGTGEMTAFGRGEVSGGAPVATGAAVPTGDGRVSARLAELGIALPAVPAPAGAYVPALRTGDLVFTAGQLPLVDGDLPLTGAVGDQPVDVSAEDAAGLARICAVNALAAVAGVVDLDRVRQVVKVVGYVASAPGFARQPSVVDGASQLLQEVFGDAGRHARSAVGVAALPLSAPVEVEVVFAVD